MLLRSGKIIGPKPRMQERLIEQNESNECNCYLRERMQKLKEEIDFFLSFLAQQIGILEEFSL